MSLAKQLKESHAPRASLSVNENGSCLTLTIDDHAMLSRSSEEDGYDLMGILQSAGLKVPRANDPTAEHLEVEYGGKRWHYDGDLMNDPEEELRIEGSLHFLPVDGWDSLQESSIPDRFKVTYHTGSPSWHQRKAGHTSAGTITTYHTQGEIDAFLKRYRDRGESLTYKIHDEKPIEWELKRQYTKGYPNDYGTKIIVAVTEDEARGLADAYSPNEGWKDKEQTSCAPRA